VPGAGCDGDAVHCKRQALAEALELRSHLLNLIERACRSSFGLTRFCLLDDLRRDWGLIAFIVSSIMLTGSVAVEYFGIVRFS
jgi:hypothetical protein